MYISKIPTNEPREAKFLRSETVGEVKPKVEEINVTVESSSSTVRMNCEESYDPFEEHQDDISDEEEESIVIEVEPDPEDAEPEEEAEE